MDILTSNVQVWHLVIVVLVVIIGWIVTMFALGDVESQTNYIYDATGLQPTITELHERIEKQEGYIASLKLSVNDKQRTIIPYDDFCRLEKMVFEMREGSYRRRVARWLGLY